MKAQKETEEKRKRKAESKPTTRKGRGRGRGCGKQGDEELSNEEAEQEAEAEGQDGRKKTSRKCPESEDSSILPIPLSLRMVQDLQPTSSLSLPSRRETLSKGSLPMSPPSCDAKREQ